MTQWGGINRIISIMSRAESAMFAGRSVLRLGNGHCPWPVMIHDSLQRRVEGNKEKEIK